MKDNARYAHFRLWCILAALAAVVLGCASLDPPPPAKKGDTKDADRQEIVTKLVDAHNKEREHDDLPPLELNKKLTAAARKHAEDMAEHQKMSHTGSNGTTPFRRMEKEGYKYQRAAENVARGQLSVDEVMKVWMDSEDHKHNILGKFSEIGVGHATDADGVSYWCVTFGTPLP
jgi:uncharacterized protein YkwD